MNSARHTEREREPAEQGKRKLTIETAALGPVSVEKTQRDDEDQEETGDHHGDYRSHGHGFCKKEEKKEKLQKCTK